MAHYVLGINGSYHNSSVSLLDLERDEPVLICSEDRHSGIPHYQGFPWVGLLEAVKKAGGNEKIIAAGYSRDKEAYRNPPQDYFNDILISEMDHKARKGIQKICKLIENNFPHISFLENECSTLIKNLEFNLIDLLVLKKRINYLLVKFANEIFTEYQIKKILPNVEIKSFNHHLCHAAIYFASRFEHAAVITWDGRGEFDTTVLWEGRNQKLERFSSIFHPYSLGLFYEIFSVYLGFDHLSGPGKLMGLAAYGDNRFEELFKKLIQCCDNEFSFDFHPEYIICHLSDRLKLSQKLIDIIGPPRKQDEKINSRHQAIAYGVQKACEAIAIKLIDYAQRKIGTKNIVLSGGLSLNCVINEQIRATCDSDIFVLPPCGDDGTSLGAAILLKKEYLRKSNCFNKRRTGLKVKYLKHYGTSNSKEEVKAYLDKEQLRCHEITPREIAKMIYENKIIGYIEGPYEFGPRALCHRSILANPKYLSNWHKINQQIKYREDFRPFAPVMLLEDAINLWGDLTKPVESPYMLQAPVMNTRAADLIPAVTHVDLTSRIQTVTRETHPSIVAALEEFKRLSGIGCFLNTSLNMSGESIIIDFKDLIRFLFVSNMDAAIIEGILINKQENQQVAHKISQKFPSKEHYLIERQNRHKIFLSKNNLSSKYYNFFEFYKLIFKEDIQ
jgi:carbamoyltransferase